MSISVWIFLCIIQFGHLTPLLCSPRSQPGLSFKPVFKLPQVFCVHVLVELVTLCNCASITTRRHFWLTIWHSCIWIYFLVWLYRILSFFFFQAEADLCMFNLSIFSISIARYCWNCSQFCNPCLCETNVYLIFNFNIYSTYMPG